MHGLETLTLWGYVWIGVVLLGAGFAHGVIGVGFPLIAMPLLALVLPFKAAMLFLVLPMLFVIAVNSFWGGHLRESILRFWYMPIVPVAGGWIGTRVLIGAPPEPFLLALALMLLVYLLRERLGHGEVALVRRNVVVFGILAGVISGFFEAVTNVSLPPMIVFLTMAGVSPMAMVQILNFSSLGTKASQIATWSAWGGVPLAFWVAALPWSLATTAAVLAGARLRSRVDARRYLGWLRRFLWAMAILLVLQFLRAVLTGD